MVAVQVVLLKIALDHRPPPYSRGGDAAVPFARVNESQRPFDFWQWRSPKPWVPWQTSISENKGRLTFGK
jgi:hypothetical protein